MSELAEKIEGWRRLVSETLGQKIATCEAELASFAVTRDRQALQMSRALREAADAVDALEMKHLYYLARLDGLEKALRFYAKERSWGSEGICYLGVNWTGRDRGRTARRALAMDEP